MAPSIGVLALLFQSQVPWASPREPAQRNPDASATSGLNAGLVVYYDFDKIRYVKVGGAVEVKVENEAPISDRTQDDGLVTNPVDPMPLVADPHGQPGIQLYHDPATPSLDSQQIDVLPTPGSNASPQANLQLNTFTIAAWIRITDADTQEANWEVAEKAGSYWLNIRNDNDTLGFPPSARNETDPHLTLRCGGLLGSAGVAGNETYVDSPAGAVQVGPNAPWTFVACTYNDLSLTEYLTAASGSQVNPVTEVGTTRVCPPGAAPTCYLTVVNTYPLAVGGNDKPNDPDPVWQQYPEEDFLGGDMAQFRLYNRALTAGQLSTIAGTF